jgi:hypothetical protein
LPDTSAYLRFAYLWQDFLSETWAIPASDSPRLSNVSCYLITRTTWWMEEFAWKTLESKVLSGVGTVQSQFWPFSNLTDEWIEPPKNDWIPFLFTWTVSEEISTTTFGWCSVQKETASYYRMVPAPKLAAS